MSSERSEISRVSSQSSARRFWVKARAAKACLRLKSLNGRRTNEVLKEHRDPRRPVRPRERPHEYAPLQLRHCAVAVALTLKAHIWNSSLPSSTLPSISLATTAHTC